MYDTMQIHDIVFIKLKLSYNVLYLNMGYKLKRYFQRAVINTVAITGVPHQIVGTIHFISSVWTGRPGEGSTGGKVRQGGSPPREGPPTEGVRDGCGRRCGTREARERPQTHCLEVQMIDTMVHV